MQLRWLVTVALVGLLAACGSKDGNTQNPPPSGGTDSGTTCANPCGSNCCTAEQTCNQGTKACEAKQCVPNCTGKQCGEDGCGGSCGMCLAGQTCTAGGTCSQCTPNCNGKSCGDDGCGGTCAPGCGSNETCTAGVCIPGGSSDGGTTGTDGGMIPADGGTTLPPDAGTSSNMNDTCAMPELLNLSGGTVVINGDTTNAKNDYRSTKCSVGGGNDLVFQFTTTAVQNILVKVTPSGASPMQDPVIYVRKDANCASTTSADELQCFDGYGGDASMTLKSLPAGTYDLIIDSYTSGSGSFTATITATTPLPPPANDTCTGTVTDLNLSSGTASVTGDTTDAVADYSGTCSTGTSTGSDVVYKFTLSGSQAVTAKVTRDASASTSFTPVVYIRSVCDSSVTTDQKACATSSSGVASATAKNLAAGTYFVIVDSSSSAGGKFKLDVTASAPIPAPVNDTCTGTVPDLTFTNGAASITGDTTDANPDYAGTCSSGSSSGNDVVYQFTTTADQSVTVKVTRDAAASTSFTPVVYVRSTCASSTAADQAGCALSSSGSGTAAIGYLAKGTYYVIVDSSGTTGGKFTLDVTLAAPVLGDTCAKPETLTFTNGTATATGDNTNFTNDISSDCGGSGNDLVYSFTTTVNQSLTVTVTPKSGSTLEPVISLRTACADSATEVDCNDSGFGGSAATLTVPILKPGTYFLWVDGYAGSKGTFDLSATLGTPAAAAANDACSGATKLMFTNNTASVTGSTATSSTTLVTDDAKGSCQSSSTAGNDLVYQLDLTAAQKVSVKVTPTGTTYKPVVYLRKSSCTSTAAGDEIACGNAISSGKATGLLQYNLAAGSYWIFVDSDGSAAGDFTLDVTLDNPITGAPTNESCTAPGMLTLTNNAASATGQTITAVNDATGSCSGTGNTSPDVVYQFTTTAAQQLVAVVTAQSTTPSFRPIVYLRKNACTSAATTDEVACSKTSATYEGTLARLDNAPAGTYYAFVEGSAANDTGEFKLDIVSAAPPANDSCTGTVQALAAGRAVNGTTFGAKDDFGTGTISAACDLDLYGTYDGQDVVYSYTPTSAGPVTVTVTPTTPTFDPAVWVASGTTCAAATALSACVSGADLGGRGDEEKLTFTATANTTYYIVVDSYKSAISTPPDLGQFTITVK